MLVLLYLPMILDCLFLFSNSFHATKQKLCGLFYCGGVVLFVCLILLLLLFGWLGFIKLVGV